jgi:hypothetical protein
MQKMRRAIAIIANSLAAMLSAGTAYAAPEDELAVVVKRALDKNFVGDWRDIEKLPRTRWAPLPPEMLNDCLPDGGCFTRRGQATIGGRALALTASGSRHGAGTLYLRNGMAPFGEAALLAALKRAGLAPELARCPVPGGKGGQNWYRLKGAGLNPGVLAVQSSCNGQPCEGFVLTLDPQLPALPAQQLRLYSEQCSGAGGERKPVSTSLPHLELAKVLTGLMAAGAGALPDWKALPDLSPALKWDAAGPKKMDLSFKNDRNPYGLSGTTTLAQRTYHLLASGSAMQAATIYFDEAQMHRPGEDLLGALRAEGLGVQLARCGPVYTHSSNNWYRVSGPRTRPAMLQQAIRRDGTQLQDAYVLRLDNALPQRDARDRDPGVDGCR